MGICYREVSRLELLERSTDLVRAFFVRGDKGGAVSAHIKLAKVLFVTRSPVADDFWAVWVVGIRIETPSTIKTKVHYQSLFHPTICTTQRLERDECNKTKTRSWQNSYLTDS